MKIQNSELKWRLLCWSPAAFYCFGATLLYPTTLSATSYA